jgi:hypothetical protein
MLNCDLFCDIEKEGRSHKVLLQPQIETIINFLQRNFDREFSVDEIISIEKQLLVIFFPLKKKKKKQKKKKNQRKNYQKRTKKKKKNRHTK